MPELLLEMFSEEIPARMQARGADDLARLVGEALAALHPTEVRAHAGPRRIALTATVSEGVAERRGSERGPRVAAPEQALAGFLRKHGAARDELRHEGDFWVLERVVPGADAASLIAAQMPPLLRRFPWPKSMRWGGTSRFAWVRPLRRILCILDGEIVPFDLRDGDDDGHGLASGDVSEGHRFLAPGAFAVASAAQWRDTLRVRHVIVDAAERRALVAKGVAGKAAERGLSVVEDAGLLDEVAGLVEWPVPLLGRIDGAHMDLPPEVMQVSMRVNQRYFALRDARGSAAPWFAFVANIAADDGGAAIVAGNERVLRARFSDARHFWDLDRKRTLESRVEDLASVMFHAKIGTQHERVQRLCRIARAVAPMVGADPDQAERAALLCKADLTTGMVGEFPELQGVMGGYYARHDGEDGAVCEAVRDHYAPRGPEDLVPSAPVTVAVALADKLDQLVQFFAIGEKPTGSGDPFALRRAALGIIRLLRGSDSGLPLTFLAEFAGAGDRSHEIVDFLKDRLAIQLRVEGQRYDVIKAAFVDNEDRIDLLCERVPTLGKLLDMQVGADLLAGYRRARRIVDLENLRDGPHGSQYDSALLKESAESSLAGALRMSELSVGLRTYDQAVQGLAALRAPLDKFFDNVTVNDPDRQLRHNRLALLGAVIERMHHVADFSQIQG